MENKSVRRLNKARDLIGARRYLEIGVFEGETFNAFDCARKDAVDPEFRFDPAAHDGPGTRFFRETSDAFFLAPERRGEPPYDLCFIDGLHTYEQTLRDFLNVLVRTHDRSLILIDDTYPNDVYSAEPDLRRTQFHRKRVGSPKMSWHGDVYKLVFFIHDFIPTLSYATIQGSGNPQTLVWRQTRTHFAPQIGDTEAISRLGYFDMFERRALLNFAEEDEAMDRAARALAQPG